jgi:tRNA(Arg) A34 adenosine deaminase TadA
MRSRTDSDFMTLALEEARLAGSRGEVPIGAIVVRAGQVLASAGNQREADSDPTAHAEVLALRDAAKVIGSWRLDGCTVYVTLEPCAMCAGAMVLARIDRCVYGTTDPKGGFVGTLGDLSDHPGLNHQFDVESGVAQQACSRLLTDFFRELRERNR